GKWGATCGSPTPDVRNNLRLTWHTPWRLKPSLLWRYISRVDHLNTSGTDLAERHYFDLAAIWDYSDAIRLRAGINNLLDKAPPLVGGAAGPSIEGNGNTFPGLYDALGRFVFIGLSVDLS
ncbi:MAG: TonB-dependent receptor, partial [Candidatus Tectomicrobia bacterium]|nr:TonB-dependent receptor [Candidatus Tectomicrobia bacterium]